MKKDRMKELLTELRDREFDLKECYNLFDGIDSFINSVESRSKSNNPEFKDFYDHEVNFYRTTLENLLSEYGLDYTVDEFITYD